MASSVVTASCTDVLREPFDNLAAWTGFLSSVTGGRTGNMGQLTGASTGAYTIPAAAENATITIGFAFKVSSIAAARVFLYLNSDSNGLHHETFSVTTTGAIEVRRGNVAGTVLGTSASGLIAINTWNYFEAQVLMHDTAGTVIVRLNGTQIINLTGVDTKAAGTKAVYDSVELSAGGSGTTHNFDDLYLSSGAGCSFKGDQTVVNTGPDVLLEPFNNLTAWAVTGSPTGIVAGGRTGTAVEFAAFSSTFISYAIPTPAQSDTITIGFAFRPSAIGQGEYKIIGLASDAGATDHNFISIDSNNALIVYRQSSGLLPKAPNGTIPTAGVFYYIELQIKLHDTTGSFDLHVNGTSVASATNVDTKNAGTKTVYDTVRLPPSGFNGAIVRYDDLYITMGAGAPFKGDITVP